VHKTVPVTGPAVEPITTAEAKSHLNVSGTSKDAYIDSLIVTARGQIERYLNRALITQSWKVYYDCWQKELLIPFGSLSTLTSVKYYDIDGNLQTLSTDYYWVLSTTDPARIIRKYDATYPELQYGRPDAIEIAFTAGYGATSSAIPGEIKHAMKLLITNLYENKGDIVIGPGHTVGKIPSFVTDLIHSYKLYNF
jgi:uncharacterized phiE125 gp8 family phage protein